MLPFFSIVVGVILIPICLEFGFYPIIPDTILDYRTTKDFLAVFFCLMTILGTFSRGVKIRGVSVWINILVVYCCIHHFLVPQLEFPERASNIIVNLWQYKPIVYILIYYLFFLSVRSFCWHKQYVEIVLRVMMWVGLTSAIYLIMQRLGLDSAQHLSSASANPDAQFTTAGQMSSFLTHPNYAGAFIAMCLPTAIYFRRWLYGGLMFLAVIFSGSCFAITAMCFGLFIYSWFYFYKKRTQIVGIVLILGMIFCWMCLIGRLWIPSDSGRFLVWREMWEDVRARPIFGYGLGSFRLLFPLLHGSRFTEAHNEFFQLIYETGFVGGLIFLKCIVDFVKQCVLKVTQYDSPPEINLAMFSMLCIILLSSLGLFVWQIEPHRFYTVLIVGILTNLNSRKEREENEKEYSFDGSCGVVPVVPVCA